MITAKHHGSPAPLTAAATERPWEAESILPEPPSPHTYGYLAGRKLHTCSVEELMEKCAAIQIPEVLLVWTPENPRLLPMTEVPILRPALLSRFRYRMRVSVFYLAAGILSVGMESCIDDTRRRHWPILAVFLVVPALQSVIETLMARRAYEREETPAQERDVAARFGFWLGSQRSPATYVVAAGILLVAVCQMVRGLSSSITAAGLVKNAVRDGQVWRLLTAGTLHANLWHLLGNVAALLALGRMVEVLAHWSRFGLVLLLSILSGSLLSTALLPETTSVGASGGLMGLLGFLLVLGRRLDRGLPPRFARSLVKGVLWVAATGVLAYAFIDNAAHLGGLLAGVGIGLALVPRDGVLPLPAPPITTRIGAAAMTALILVVLVCVAVLLTGRP